MNREMSTHASIDYPAVLETLTGHMEAEGYLTEHDEKAKTFKILGQKHEMKGKIFGKIGEMIKRT
jgi:hypothetical protein